METYEPITLLHISDTQFGKNHRFEKGGFLASIKDDLKRLEEDFRLKPQVVVLSGDLTETGSRNEFEAVLEFANGLAELGIPKKHFAIIPGNHDVYRGNYPGSEEQQPVEPYWQKWEHFTWFFEEFYKEVKNRDGVESKPTFTLCKPYTLFTMPDIKLVVAGLNSTMKESNKEKSGEIDDAQFKYFIEGLSTVSKGWIRVAALHHNPNEDSNRKLKRGLCHEDSRIIDLIMHGHLHDDKTEAINSVPVFGIGSAAVKEKPQKEKPPEEKLQKEKLQAPNQYQIIQILPNRVRRWRRAYYPSQDRWIGDTSIHGRGHEWKKFTPLSSANIVAAFSAESNSPFVDVADFLETGDAITAINVALDGKKLSSKHVSENDKYRYFMYKQKYGFFNDADIKSLADMPCVSPASNCLTRFGILYIKMLSQTGQFNKIMRFPGINNGIALGESEPSALESGLLRRKAIVLAITKGDTAGFGDGNCAPSRQVTTDTLLAIARYFCAWDGKNVQDLIQGLESCQAKYIEQKNDYTNLQICRYKSALQALFSEAAVLLAINERGTRGWIRLIVAHLLVPRIMITPKAEGYSELLSMIWCTEHHKKHEFWRRSHRKLIEHAMCTDYDSRMKFMAMATAKYPSAPAVFRKLARIFEIIPNSIPIPADWEGLQNFMADVERDLAS